MQRVRPSRSLRLSVYTRDGFACVWCGGTPARGARLTCDHVVPHIEPFNGPTSLDNLWTACVPCNSLRRDLPLELFAAYLTARGLDGTSIVLRALSRAGMNTAA